jgi:hypothetical protein
MSDFAIENRTEITEPVKEKKKRGRPRKIVAPVPTVEPKDAWDVVAKSHPVAYATATLRLIAKMSADDVVQTTALNAAGKLERAAAV